MADPAVTEVLSDAAILLGDLAQEQFTNPVLLPWYSFAYRELYDLCQRWRLPLGQRTAYMVLPANQNVLIPSAIGYPDFGEPIALGERSPVGTVAVSGVTNATPVVVTTGSVHNLSSNGEVELSGIVGPVGVNGQSFVTVLSSTTFSLNGSVAGGAYVSGGTVVTGIGDFSPMAPVQALPQFVPALYLGVWLWQNQRLQFVGASQAVEIQVTYTASGAAPQTGSVGINDSRNFLAQRTASLIGPAYDMPTTAERCLLEAFGPSKTSDGSGGALRNCVQPMLLAKQLTTKRPGPFRPNRNMTTRTIW